MLLLIAAWSAGSMLTLWALFVAGRLRSPLMSKVALTVGTAPMVGLVAAALPRPRWELADLAWAAGVGAGLLVVWGVAVHWARQKPPTPKVDAARMRWAPRPSHRPTWVLAAGLSTLLTLSLFVMDRPLVGLMPWVGLLVAHRWAHQGERGLVRVEARDIVLGGERIAIDEMAPVRREVRFLGPVRRERLVLQHGNRRLSWLVTGSPPDHVLAVQHLLLQQQDLAAAHTVERGPNQLPPQWLQHVHESGGRPFALRPNREAT